MTNSKDRIQCLPYLCRDSKLKKEVSDVENCIFCKIIAQTAPCYKIYENDYVLAFLDIAKNAEGHIILVPKTHCVNLLDASEEQVIELAKATKIISKHLLEKCGFTGINTFNANGESAQQTVPHFHIHIIPRKEKDGLEAWRLEEKFNFDLNLIHKRLTLIK